VGRDIAEEDDEFFAAIPEDCPAARDEAELRRGHAKYLIADFSTEGPLEMLEMVHTHQGGNVFAAQLL
jgi:hypothetical protein